MILIDILASGAIDSTGQPLDSGTAYVYKVGTTTLATIYSDRECSEPASNPVTLDSSGRAEVYATEEVRVVLEDSEGNEVYDIASLGTVSDATESGGSGESITTRLERIASARTPNFYSSADSVVTIPATNEKPATVIIDEVVYVNYSDQTCTMSVSGRGGLDTGAVAASTIYYLYVIPASDGVGWDAVASVTDPDTGPTGFSSWRYIGSFGTDESENIVSFRYVRGNLKFGSYPGNGYQVTVSNASPLSSKTLNIPTTARFAHIQMTWSAVNAAADDLFYCAKSSGTAITLLNAASTTAANIAREQDSIAILTSKTAYFYCTSASDAVNIDVQGWIEDPMEWA